MSIEVMRGALWALTCTGEEDDPGHRCGCCDDYVDRNGHVRAALRAAIEQALTPGEPVAWAMKRKDGLLLDIITPEEHESYEGEYTVPLYTAPQPKQWVGLTETDLANCDTDEYETARRWERLLREKNGGAV
jgi:hypothetical protein